MRKNHPISTKFSEEDKKLINQVLEKLNQETRLRITLSDLVRLGTLNLCKQIQSGSITSLEVVFGSTG